MFELEFSLNHYNPDYEPIMEFGHNFFEDWDKEEWNRFDNFMLECLMLYLEEGLVPYKKINLVKKKIVRPYKCGILRVHGESLYL